MVLVCCSYRMPPASAPSGNVPEGTWTPTFSNALAEHVMTGFFGQNLRINIPASLLSLSGNWVRLTFKAHPGVPARVDGAYIGDAALSGNPYDYAATNNAEITFDEGSTGVTVPAGSSTTSDPIEFTFDEAKAKVIAVHFSPIGIGNSGISAGDLSGVNGYLRFAADETSVADVSGYSLASGGDVVHFVTLIEVLVES